MKFINLGVLAHVDAGKTSLTERLLFDAGVINHIGSVDKGDTQTDSLDLERQRGITIQSAVVAFLINDLQVNLIDTPGHSDFVAEVERALRILDAAILVISAVEGVQARTRILMRSLTKLRIPTLIFVNKIDRRGARYTELIESIRTNLSTNIIPLTQVFDIGTSQARSEPLAGEQLRASVHPVYFGSATTGEGIAQLLEAIPQLFVSKEHTIDDPSALRATIFKIERGRNNERLAYARMWGGSICKRDRIPIWSRNNDGTVVKRENRVTAVKVFERGAALTDKCAEPGSICKLSGLQEPRIGDQIGGSHFTDADSLFAPPILLTTIEPSVAGQRGELFYALQRLSEQDPLIQASQDNITGTITLNLYGEVQKEVIGATLKDSFGIDVEFRESQTVYIERPVAKGSALQEFDAKGPNFFLGHCWIATRSCADRHRYHL